jgi:hypothetical protein
MPFPKVREPEPSAAIQPEAEIMIRQWRWRIVGVALLLPFIASAEVILISFFPDTWLSSHYFDSFDPPPPRMSHADAFEAALFFPLLYIPLANWPFFVLALRARRNIMKRWPNATAARLSLWGGLIGMTAPYALGYWQVPLDLAGKGVGAAYLLIFFGPIYGSLLALIGLKFGPVLGTNPRLPD